MTEVLFGESEACSMKAGKSVILTVKTDGPTSVWMAGKRKPPKKDFAGWLPGTTEEVVCLGFMLDIGDIKEPADSRYRMELVESMYGQGEAGKYFASDICKELARLKQYLDNGETVRIWYSDAPYSRCGFYSLCRLLQKYENEVHVVKLPEYKVRGNVTVFFKNWGEISAEEFAAFLSLEKTLSKEEIRMYAVLWAELMEENSPLRAMVNGRLMGVPEDFYDFHIWKELAGRTVKEARLIGDILGKYRTNIMDEWYARRIEYLIGQGQIKVVEDAKNKYARVLSSCGM